MTWQADADAAVLGQLLSTFDHAPVWRQAQAPHNTKTVVGHVRNFGSAETEVVASYGIDGVEIICRAKDFVVPPMKFDRFTIGNLVYTAQDVKEQRGFQNQLLVYRIFCKGK